MSVGRGLFMLKADNEMHRILSHFISCDLGLEIKSAERTLPAPYCVEFWIEIVNTVRLLLDQLQIGITGTLSSTGRGFRKITTKARRSEEHTSELQSPMYLV